MVAPVRGEAQYHHDLEEFSQKFLFNNIISFRQPRRYQALSSLPGAAQRHQPTNIRFTLFNIIILWSFSSALTYCHAHRPCCSPIFQRVSKLLVKAMAWPRRCPRLFCLQTDLGNMSSSVQALRARCFAAFSLGMSRSTAAGASSQASRRLEETTAASSLAYSLRI